MYIHTTTLGGRTECLQHDKHPITNMWSQARMRQKFKKKKKFFSHSTLLTLFEPDIIPNAGASDSYEYSLMDLAYFPQNALPGHFTGL